MEGSHECQRQRDVDGVVGGGKVGYHGEAHVRKGGYSCDDLGGAM